MQTVKNNEHIANAVSNKHTLLVNIPYCSNFGFLLWEGEVLYDIGTSISSERVVKSMQLSHWLAKTAHNTT